MSRKNVIALCGVAAIIIAATSWTTTQDRVKPQQPKSQVALEKEYYTRILPRLEQTYDHLHRLFQDERTITVGVAEVEDVKMQLLFAQRRCGKLSEKDYAEKSAPLRERKAGSLKLFFEEGRVGRVEMLKKLGHLEWLAVFGKADLNTPVGVSPWP